VSAPPGRGDRPVENFRPSLIASFSLSRNTEVSARTVFSPTSPFRYVTASPPACFWHYLLFRENEAFLQAPPVKYFPTDQTSSLQTARFRLPRGPRFLRFFSWSGRRASLVELPFVEVVFFPPQLGSFPLSAIMSPPRRRRTIFSFPCSA